MFEALLESMRYIMYLIFKVAMSISVLFAVALLLEMNRCFIRLIMRTFFLHVQRGLRTIYPKKVQELTVT